VATVDPSSPADAPNPSTAERQKPANAADSSEAASEAVKRPLRQSAASRPQGKRNDTPQPTQTGSQIARLGKGAKELPGPGQGIMCFDMAAASPGGKPAPATQGLVETTTESGHKRATTESGHKRVPNSVSDKDQPNSKRQSNPVSRSGHSRSPALACDGNRLPLNESATVNSPTSGLMQRANNSKACGDCSECAESITASVLDSLGLTNPIEREQVDSILHSLQARGLKLYLDSLISEGDRCCAGSASGSPRLCQIRACVDTPSYHTVNPGVEVTVWIERGRLRDTLYNSPLFRQAHAISGVDSCRRRKPFDPHLEQPTPISSKGEHFGYSFPDHDGKVVCFLVVERAAHSAKEWLSISAENWRRNGQMDERVRSFLQLAVHGANLLREHGIVLGDVRDSTIGVNRDGNVVFQGSGNAFRYDEGSGCQLLQRRTTSFICGSISMAEKARKRLLRGRLAKTAGVRKKLPRIKRAKAAGVRTKLPRIKRNPKSTSREIDQRNNLPLDRQPTFLSPTQIAETWRGVLAKSEGFASLGDGSLHFKKVAESSPESESQDQPTSLLKASQRDLYGLLRTGLMVFNPVDEANPDRWEQEATAAEASQADMKLFLTKRIAANGPLQTQAVDRAAQFFFDGFKSLNPYKLRDHPFLTLPIHPTSIYQQIFNGDGFRVTGGEMDGVVGAPRELCNLTLKDVVVKEQKGMGAGLQSAALYETGDLITFYFGRARRGREILDDPPGRYVLAILPHYLYANGEFSEKLTLTKLAEKKAMGVCINAATMSKDRNCTIQRLKARCDSEGNIWTPIVASRKIKPGEYFGFDYGPEAANGRSFSQ
jgi:hypothetical protein